MKAARLGLRILLVLFATWKASPVFALGEYFRGEVNATLRVGAVDSSSIATLFTGFNTVSTNTIITGTHFLLDDGSFRTAGGPWTGITEYVGYIRTRSQEGRCYRATFDAFYPPDVVMIWLSPPVCVPYHSSDCGHCGPGTGMPCTLDTEELPE